MSSNAFQCYKITNGKNFMQFGFHPMHVTMITQDCSMMSTTQHEIVWFNHVNMIVSWLPYQLLITLSKLQKLPKNNICNTSRLETKHAVSCQTFFVFHMSMCCCVHNWSRALPAHQQAQTLKTHFHLWVATSFSGRGFRRLYEAGHKSRRFKSSRNTPGTKISFFL